MNRKRITAIAWATLPDAHSIRINMLGEEDAHILTEEGPDTNPHQRGYRFVFDTEQFINTRTGERLDAIMETAS